MLDEVIGKSWVPILQNEFNMEYMQKLSAWLQYYRQSRTIYPEGEDVFKALRLCPYGQVKVVILGKSPYYQPNTADGLAFSYKGGVKHLQGLQSLDVILQEIENDCYNSLNLGKDYDLSYLAKQGVLLLNSNLTVFKGEPDSHKNKGWEKLVSRILLSQIIESTPKVFMLWGDNAKDAFEAAKAQVDYRWFDNHLILKAYHPAYDLHNRDQFGDVTVKYPNGFTGCKHFSQANEFILSKGMSAVNWLSIEEPYLNQVLSDQPPF